MSGTTSVGAGKLYGLERVCQVLDFLRSTAGQALPLCSFLRRYRPKLLFYINYLVVYRPPGPSGV